MPIRPFENFQPQIADSAYVDDTAVVIGDVTIGEDSSIWPCVVARGDLHTMIIGARTNVQDGTVLHVTHRSSFLPEGRPLIIGDDVTIGHAAVVHACTLGNEVLIGMHATVLDGAVIEDRVIVGAGAVVSPGKRLESGYLYTGAPARQARPLTEHELSYFKYTADVYVKLAKRHQQSAAAAQRAACDAEMNQR
jgi:carbonic anhydrase/acetyltransferase-like protein (isoleucine patch superfamily)